MRAYLAALLVVLLTYAQGLALPGLDEIPGAGWKIQDPAFAEAVFKRFDF
ncbi:MULTISPECIES: hypothetical protein [Ralstonia solanacearum species complex]|nr:hypothetical protein [Ralstonia solanacearum]